MFAGSIISHSKVAQLLFDCVNRTSSCYSFVLLRDGNQAHPIFLRLKTYEEKFKALKGVDNGAKRSVVATKYGIPLILTEHDSSVFWLNTAKGSLAVLLYYALVMHVIFSEKN